jgi:hypothetical protein
MLFSMSNRGRGENRDIHFHFVLLFDLSFDKNSLRQGSGGQRRPFGDRSKPLAFEHVRAIFVLRTRTARMRQPYKIFM